MAEIVKELGILGSLDGRSFVARVRGRPRGSILWEGWLEFTAVDDGALYGTPRETTQPSLLALEDWANALTATYLDGALKRALTPHETFTRRGS